MAVYVDLPLWPWRGKKWAHLWTDGPIEELHVFAEQIGLKRCWFQRSRNGFPHYDVTESVRAKALAAGAVAGTREDAVRVMRQHDGGRRRYDR